jgi:6-pyruvoyltetrahydropterin/6-carboxytetrahydropterin synthase
VLEFLHAQIISGGEGGGLMYRVTKKIHFCYGHRLLDYGGKSKAVHGHNGRLEVTLESETLDGIGFVVEFGDVKRIIQGWVDERFDHTMILRKDDPLLPFLKEHGDPYFEMDGNPTSENIAKLIFDYGVSQGLPVIEVKLWETPTSCATYRK